MFVCDECQEVTLPREPQTERREGRHIKKVCLKCAGQEDEWHLLVQANKRVREQRHKRWAVEAARQPSLNALKP